MRISLWNLLPESPGRPSAWVMGLAKGSAGSQPAVRHFTQIPATGRRSRGLARPPVHALAGLDGPECGISGPDEEFTILRKTRPSKRILGVRIPGVPAGRLRIRRHRPTQSDFPVAARPGPHSSRGLGPGGARFAAESPPASQQARTPYGPSPDAAASTGHPHRYGPHWQRSREMAAGRQAWPGRPRRPEPPLGCE